MSANTIRDYLSLPSSARVDSPAQAQQWLDALASGGISALGSVSDSIRSKLTTAILNDIGAASGKREGDYLLNIRSDVRWNANTRLSALKVLKELSRLPGGSAPLGKPEALRILLQQVDFPKQRVRRLSSSASKPAGLSGISSQNVAADATSANSVPVASTSSASASGYSLGSIAKTLRRAVSRRGSQQSERNAKDKDTSPSSDSTTEEYDMSDDPDWPITDMALRCLNNALFLNEDARLPFSTEDVGGGHVAVALLARPEDTPADILFLGARLLFFSTLFESPFNKIAVATLNAVRVEARCVDALVKASLDKAADRNAASSVLVASGAPAQLNTALSDLLKAHFNICLYYPRLADAEAKQQQAEEADTQSSEPTKAAEATAIVGEAFHSELLEMLPPLISVLTTLPLPSPVPLMPPFTHAIAALLNYPVTHVKSQITSAKPKSGSNNSGAANKAALTAPISPTSSAALNTAPKYISRLIMFADLMLARYFGGASSAADDGRRVPEDADAKSVQQKASSDGIELEDTLEPLLLLLRKTSSEDADMRATLCSILLPSDLDRSVALDRRSDVLGRLVRLMSSVTLPRSARAAGELLLSLCDADAKRMTETIGYGPCAGFLMNTGLASALPSGVAPTGANGRTVDPITGEYEPTEEERALDEIDRMTDAEKEAEAERLFVLFDRLNKTGVVQVRHPMAAAHESGRFEEIEAQTAQQEAERQEQEDQQTERDVEREMAAHKRRKEEAKLRAQKLAQPKPVQAEAAARVDAAVEQQAPAAAIEPVEAVEHDARSETAQ
ncbi:uncharacterized protein PAN0_019d5770 [Moesziomyces antarcticus]|uniref:Uncharacterized protein n=2 Tax=Pseudozyma antarctica TaxID=84753 RepID=A0A081CLJ6_PSEA2|nr:uncharacterized protein PAN0_019d5770 [Moesziomyces antarcticus]GAK67542.1 conserved hypothetical protein [Moesziomyces antarcticus]SPO48807.1 uncharacterized protein PSANT_06498 [Moesziomyces antarcticus]